MALIQLQSQGPTQVAGSKFSKRLARYISGASIISLLLLLSACGDTGERRGVSRNAGDSATELTTTPVAGASDTMETPAVSEIDETSGTTGMTDAAETDEVIGTPQDGSAEVVLQVADVMADPARFAEQTLMVTGEVDDVYSTTAIKLDDEAPLRGGVDNDLLVLLRAAAATGARSTTGGTAPTGVAGTAAAGEHGAGGDATIREDLEDDAILASGTLRIVAASEIEQELGLDLEPELEAEFEGTRAVLIADSISPAPEAAGPSAPGVGGGALTDQVQSQDRAVAEITGNAEQYLDQEVAVTGEVEDVQGSTFKLDDEGVFTGGIDNDLLVLSDRALAAESLEGLEDQELRVVGIVRRADRSLLEQELGANEVDERLLSRWENRVVLVATSIEAANEPR